MKPQSPSRGSPPRSLSPIGQPLGHLPVVWVPSSYMTRPAHHRAPRSPDEPKEANMGVHPCLETATEGVIARVMPWPLWSHGATWWPLLEWLSILGSWVSFHSEGRRPHRVARFTQHKGMQPWLLARRPEVLAGYSPAKGKSLLDRTLHGQAASTPRTNLGRRVSSLTCPSSMSRPPSSGHTVGLWVLRAQALSWAQVHIAHRPSLWSGHSPSAGVTERFMQGQGEGSSGLPS